MKKLILFSGVLLFSLSLAAQRPGRYLTIGPGWSFPTVLDEATSPLRYRGHTFLLSSSLDFFKERHLEQFHFLGWMGTVRPAASPGLTGSAMTYLRGEFRWTNQYRLTTAADATWRAYLGWGFLTMGSYRLHNLYSNNDEVFEYFNSASLEATVRYPFRLWQRRFEVRAGLSLPVLSVTVYPLYNRGRPEAFLEVQESNFEAGWRSLRLVSWGSYFRLSSQFSLDYYLRNGNGLRLSYYWDYFHFAKERPVRSGLQGLFVSTLFNF